MIRKYLYRIVFSIVTILFLTNRVQAQYASEEELKTSANLMFQEKKYVDALPLFSQLLSLYPKDLNYNYKYGACILFGSRDKEKAIQYLKFSTTKSTVDPVAFYYLAKAYHHNYQFAPAIVNYNKFKDKTTTKEHQDYQVDREIKMCENGGKLLTGITDIGVLSKKEIKEADFFRLYNLKGIGGKIIIKPEEFKTKLDKKNNETSIIYLSEAKNMVVFSSFGSSGSSGKDIYKVVKLPNGEWSKPSSIGDEINTEFDEDYPYLHPDGKTLYFSSKGYNSMGGFDIFKSTLDPTSGKWTYPENLDFPINTPDDDILYISDIDNKLAYFASSRASQQGELTVYNVTVDAPPAENSVIKGYFLAESNPSMKSATITIKDVEKDRKYGVYTTNNETGQYLLVFPQSGGKFKLLVETTNDAPIHSATIEIPKLDGFRALKQELRLVGTGDNEKLVVKNLFDESDEFDINDPLVVQNILQQKAKLDVNTTEDELTNLNNVLANQEQPTSNYKELSNEQIIKTVDQKANKIIEQTNKSKEQANYSYQIASQKSLKAKNLYTDSEKLITEAQQITSASEKDKKLELAEQKKLEAAKLINEAVAILNIARILDSEVTDRESDITSVKSIKEIVNSSINDGNRSEAENNLAKLDEIASASYHNESALANEEKIQNQKLEEKQQLYNKTRDDATALLNRELELTETVNKLEAKKEATKNKTEKADLDAQIKALTIDIDDSKFERNNAKTKEVIAKKEYDDTQNQVEITKAALANINLNTSSVAAVTSGNKLQLENDILFFEKEGLVGLYPSSDELLTTDNANKEVYQLIEHKDEFNVIDENGKMIDYNTQYSVELSKLDNYGNEVDKPQLIARINQEWIKSIDEEIEIRKNQLKGEINNTDKDKYEKRIASLAILKSEKQKEINENTILAVNNTTTTNNTEEVPLVNKEGNVVDYNAEYTNKLNSFTGEDTYETYTQKAAIHTNWAKATEQDIAIKKQQLSTATPENKNSIANEIAVLENNLQEQQEFAALFNSQAESIKTTALVADKPTTNENNSTTEKTNVVSNENKGEDYQKKYTDELNSITGEDTYETYTKKAEIHSNWAKATEEEITTKKQQLATATPENKNSIANEIAVLENNLQEQQEFAALFNSQAESIKTTALVADKPTTNENNSTNEKTNVVSNENKAELTKEEKAKEEANLTVNNLNAKEDEFSNLKYNNNFKYESTQSRKTIEAIVELKNQARTLDEEANVLLNTANTAKTKEEKDALIIKVEALKTQSNNKQEEIAKIYETANRTEFYNNQAVLSKLKTANKDPFSNDVLMTELFVEEADNYFAEAKVKREDAIKAENITAKENALQKAYELEMKALEKQNKAIQQLAKGDTENLYAVTNENTATTNETTTNTSNTNEKININNNQPANVTPVATNIEITKADQDVILNLKPEEITTIKNSEDYKVYAELKKENRRLTKEAEVEYVEAEKLKQEVKDQQQLGVSLKAMADGASSEEDKAKKLAQIEKLNKMIAENETKSSELKQSAVDKENKAKDANEKSNFILINADENASKSIVAIEKTETFEPKFLADAMNRTTVPIVDQSVVDKPIIDKPVVDQPVVDKPIIDKPVVDQPVVDKPIIDKPVVDQPVVDKPIIDKPIVDQPVKTTPTNIDEIPTVLNNSIFVINNTNEAVYNENKKIPVSPKLPEGLVFKVQIGAFRNPIPQNHYKGFAPIMAEDAGNGITRYTAGFFKTFNMANEAKNSIRSIGYDDAFVVAFMNGKRININEARAMQNGNTVDEGNFTVNATNNTNNKENVVNNNNTNTTNKTVVTEEVKDGVSTDVRNIGGVFYSIQVGVYSKPVTADQLSNVSPLNSERTPNGLIRYTSGVYKNLADANIAKDKIRALGIADAFVVAYNGGTKITVNEATQLLSSGSSTVNTPTNNTPTIETPVIEKKPAIETPVIEKNSGEEAPVTNNIIGDEAKTDLKLEFKVKLGEYEEDVPVEDAGLFLQLTGRGVKNYEENNKTVYTIGSFPDYNSALDLQIEMKELGVKKPETIVFKDGVQIKLEEALELMKNNQ